MENGPETTPLCGGLPRVFPVIEALLFGQAEETAGPCRLRDRDFSPEDGSIAERGSAVGRRTSDG